MAKRQRNKENMFELRKTEKAESKHKIFSEFIKLPFWSHQTQVKENSKGDLSLWGGVPAIIDSSFVTRRLMEISSEASNESKAKLIESLVKIINGEKIDLKLKNVHFNCPNLEGNFIYINENKFLEVISEYSLKRMMEFAEYSGHRNVKDIRKSLIFHVVNSLNNSLKKEKNE